MPSVLVVAFIASLGSGVARAAPPLEAYADLPRIAQAALSPDGRSIAELRHEGEQSLVVTHPVDGGEPVRVAYRSEDVHAAIQWVHWASNERLIVATAGLGNSPKPIDHGDIGLISVRADGSGAFRLLERLSDFNYFGVSLPKRVVDWMPEDGHHIMVEINEPRQMDLSEFRADGRPERVDPSVYLANVDDNGSRRVMTPRPDMSDWITDMQHRVRIGTRRRDDDVTVMACDPDGSNWRALWHYKRLSRETVVPLGFDRDPNRLFVSADHQGRRAIFEVDLRDRGLPMKLRYSHPVFDVAGPLLRRPADEAPIGVFVGLPGIAESESGPIWDAASRLPFGAVDRALPGRVNHVLGWSHDERVLLVDSVANGMPDRFVVARMQAGGSASLVELDSPYPGLPLQSLAAKRPVRVEARDGRLLVAFLSLPPGAAPAGLPAVVMPHGGPQSADDAAFDPWVEFLVSRGYAVLQINFRGSIGAGWDQMAAGLQRWGLEMQDDVTDATRWLLKSGIADPARIAIVGASYGGYSALMGAIREPSLYRCAVSLAGVTDLIDLARRYWDQPELRLGFELQIGDPARDRERLIATSPLRQATRIRIPILLVHGTDDTVVPYGQSERMAEALSAAGVPNRLLSLEHADHGLSRSLDRRAFLAALEGFLAEQIGSKKPTPE